ncbi:sensor histidine kinase [Gilvimarinus sp. SDUM040013]|uniref:histidine kinase n=1 Tax=Gilvimarinus gilvus TaxID=3058038 RepID=A0ABU4S172_9GAMM|nr:sensor histidine kinase [Gilvimarinus sp. SDUM040013]MDO3387162.1 sensor histidine kinase [Gilvimarinus sp. SDUM040013]MDX6850905.1 sensor histidine kinase [Gilvimarinus sp. SDUM040013]
MQESLSLFIRRLFSPHGPDATLWRPWRGPFERWPHATDLLIALSSLFLNLLMWSRGSSGDVMALQSLPDVGVYLCAFVANFALLWRRSYPWQVHGVVLLVSILLYLVAPVHGVVALAFSLYSLGRYEANNQASVLGAFVASMFVAVDLLLVNTANAGGAIAAILVLALWYFGRRLRFRGEYLRLLEERARYLERERDLDAERAVIAERARIAREMHDVVAHQVSLMTVQAGAARTIAPSDVAAASEAMASVELAGRQALSEMRHLLSLMRPDDLEEPIDPQPGIGDLTNLVRQVSDVGLEVELITLGDVSALAARLELTIYRIVQEALTNVIKHAGAQAKVVVTLDGRNEDLELTIMDNGGFTKGVNKSGHGIVGMRERVALLGGSFSAGFKANAGSNNGFEVCAILPRKLKET